MKTTVLTTFASDVQAHMLQDLLKNEGIESMLQGELTNQVMSPLAGLGIRVVVFEDDLKRAKVVLKESFPEQAEE